MKKTKKVVAAKKVRATKPTSSQSVLYAQLPVPVLSAIVVSGALIILAISAVVGYTLQVASLPPQPEVYARTQPSPTVAGAMDVK